MTRKQKYLAFLESAAKSSPKNAELLGAVAAGFRACFEGEEDLSWENSDGISNEYLQKKLDEGVPPKELFTKILSVGGDGLRPVLIGADDKYGDKWNFIDANNHLVSKIWFDAISGEDLGNPFKGDPSVQEVELNGW